MQAIWTISQVILPIARFGKLPLIWTLLADDIGSARGQDHEASEASDHKDRFLGGIPLGAVSHRGRCKHPRPAPHRPRPYAIQAAPNGIPPKYLPLQGGMGGANTPICPSSPHSWDAINR